MRVILHDASGILERVEASGAMSLYTGDRYIHTAPPGVVADIDHPGTRGLLLQQYRDASGHEHAGVEWCDDGAWWVLIEPFNDPEQRPHVGCGESEGAAILDALTRLAASKAAAEVETGSDEDYRQRVNTLAGRMNVFEARLTRIESTLANIADRMANLDGMGAP